MVVLDTVVLYCRGKMSMFFIMDLIYSLDTSIDQSPVRSIKTFKDKGLTHGREK